MILTNENYYSLEANREYFSVSQLKSFMDCEAKAMAELSGEYVRPSTQALLVGSYIDAHFSHELDMFRAKHPEIYTKTGSLRAEYQQAEEIIGRIERDPLAMMMLSGDTQKIVTGEIEGVPFKSKLDSLLSAEQCGKIVKAYPKMQELLFADGAIVDLKIVRDFNPLYREGEGKLHFIDYWHYDLQLAIYQRLVGGKLPDYILAATKEPVTDLGLFYLPNEALDVAYKLGTADLPHYAQVKRGEIEPEACGKCDWCKQQKKLTCGERFGLEVAL